MLIELSYLTTMLGHSACMQVLGEVGGSSQVLASVFGWLQTLIMVLGELSPLFYIAATQVLVLV